MATAQDQAQPISVPQHEAFLEEQLGRARRRVRAFDVAAGVLGLAAGTLLYGLGMMLLDRSLEFSGVTRLLALGFYAVAALAWTARFIVWPVFRDVNPYYAALRVEGTLPGAKNSIVNWLDLRGRKLPPAIRSAVGNRAAHDLAAADIDQAISGRRVVYLGSLTAVIFLATIATLFILRPAQFFSLFNRAFAPFTGSGVVTQTQIDLLEPSGGNVTVPVNQPVNFRVRVGGKVPQAGKPDALKLLFRYTQEETVYQERALDPVAGSRDWEVRLPGFEVKNGFWYRITGGDAKTEEYRVTARALPAIERFEVVYKYRPYLHRKDRNDTSPTLQELRGTEVLLTARTNRNVTEGLLHFEGDGEQPKAVKAELMPNQPDALRFRFTLDKEGLYRIRFRSSAEEESGDSIPYQIRVQPDLAPRVVLTRPGEDITLPANGTLAVEGSANDDSGITDLTLRMRIKDGDTLLPKVYRGDEKRPGHSPFRFANGTYPTQLEYKDFVNLSDLKNERGERVKLRPKMVIEYWLEATDNCDYPQPNVGRTEKSYLVTIADPPADPKLLEEERKRLDDEHKKLEQEQKDHNAKQDKQLQKEDKDRQNADKPELQPEKNPLEKQADEIQKELAKERDKGELKKDEAKPDQGQQKDPGQQDNPKDPAGQEKTPPKDQPKDKPGEKKPQDRDGQKNPTPQDQKGQNKPEPAKQGDQNQNAGEKKPEGQGVRDDKKPGEKKEPGNKPDAQQASKDKGESTGKPGDKPGEGKKEGQPQGAGDQANAKPPAEAAPPGADKPEATTAGKGAPKPEGAQGKPTGDTAKGGDKKDGPGDKGEHGEKKGTAPGDMAKANGNTKPEGESSAGNQTAGAGNKPQENATKDDVAKTAKDLAGVSGQQRKDDVKDLQDMAANARDSQVRDAAKEALKKAGEQMAGGNNPGTEPGKPQGDMNDVTGKPAPKGEEATGSGKGNAPDDAKASGETKPPDPNAGKSKTDPGDPKGDGEGKQGAGDAKQGSGDGPKSKEPGKTTTAGNTPGGSENGGRKEPNDGGSGDGAEIAAMAKDLRDKLKAGDLLLRNFEEAARDKDTLKKRFEMTPEEAERFMKDYRQQMKDWVDELKELEQIQKNGATGPYSSGPRTVEKPKGPTKDAIQTGGPIVPPSEFEKSYREFTQELSRMKPKKEK